MLTGRKCAANDPGGVRFLTIIRHVAVSSLQHQVDVVAPPADLLHRLAVGHPSGAVPVDLHQLITDLQATQSQS